MRMTFITIIALLLFILSILLSYTIKKEVLKPIEFNVIAGLIIAIGTIFGLFGKYLQDSKSSQKSSQILEKITELQTENKTLQNENKKLHELQSEKSSTIISLQDKLITQAENQSKEISDISNPIPVKLDLNFDSEIVLTSKEQSEINNFLDENKPVGNIPFNAKKGSCEKIDRLKDVVFNITIRIESKGKTLKIRYENKITNLLGYSTNNPQNAFHLTYDGNKLNFSAYRIFIDDIEADNIPRTLNDFKNAKAHIRYTFFFPQRGHYMAIDSNFYVLKINELSLDSGGKKIEINNLRNAGTEYTGTFSF